MILLFFSMFPLFNTELMLYVEIVLFKEFRPEMNDDLSFLIFVYFFFPTLHSFLFTLLCLVLLLSFISLLPSSFSLFKHTVYFILYFFTSLIYIYDLYFALLLSISLSLFFSQLFTHFLNL